MTCPLQRVVVVGILATGQTMTVETLVVVVLTLLAIALAVINIIAAVVDLVVVTVEARYGVKED